MFWFKLSLNSTQCLWVCFSRVWKSKYNFHLISLLWYSDICSSWEELVINLRLQPLLYCYLLRGCNEKQIVRRCCSDDQKLANIRQEERERATWLYDFTTKSESERKPKFSPKWQARWAAIHREKLLSSCLSMRAHWWDILPSGTCICRNHRAFLAC